MAVPILIGIGAAVTALVTAIVEAVGKKTLIAAVLVLSMLAAYATLKAALYAVISSIPIGAMPTWMVTGISMLPTNTDDCLVAISVSYIARMAFDAALQAVHIRAES